MFHLGIAVVVVGCLCAVAASHFVHPLALLNTKSVLKEIDAAVQISARVSLFFGSFPLRNFIFFPLHSLIS